MNSSDEKFKMPNFEKYKREGDAAEHVQNYHGVMVMLHASEAVICKCFPITLTESAKLWWNTLEKRSISSFEQLSRKFVHHFLTDSKQKLPPHVLIHTRQEPRESLRAYFKRFQAKRLEVIDPGSQVAMSALIAGLRSNELTDALVLESVDNYEQLKAKAHGYMDVEEARAYKAANGHGETAVPATPTPATASVPPVLASSPPMAATPQMASPVPEPVRGLSS